MDCAGQCEGSTELDSCDVCGGDNSCMGCTDPNASNYDNLASINDGSCEYPVQKAYVTLQGQDKVAVIDINTGNILRHVDVNLTNLNDAPHYVVIDATNGYWYCTLISSGLVLKFNLVTDELIDSVSVGSSPALMELDIQNQFLYVSRFMPMMGLGTDSKEIHKIDAATMTVIGTVDVGADSPHGIALSSDGSILWVASNEASHFFKIETDKFGDDSYQPQNFPIGSEWEGAPIDFPDREYNALGLELNEDDSKLYISCSAVNQVRIFDTATGDSLETITTGMMPWHIQLTNDESKLYVTNRMGNSVSIFNLETNEISMVQDDSMNMLHGCALSNDNVLLVVTSPGSGNAYIYETSTHSLLHTINLTDGSEQNPMPTGVAIED
jgi:DNA-binding beta-propeller fold protein YncE